MNSGEFEKQQGTGMMKLDIEIKNAAMAASALLWKASASSERPRSWGRLNEWYKWQTITQINIALWKSLQKYSKML